jgi:vitamin B12 transporter
MRLKFTPDATRPDRRRITLLASTSIALLALASAPPSMAQTRLPGVVITGGTLGGQTERLVRPSGTASGQSETETTLQTDGDGQASSTATVNSSGETLVGIPSEKIGSAVAVVTGAELRAQQVRHAAEALRSLPGVQVSSSGGYGGVSQIRMRGAEGNHTLVLIDGIEANATNGGEFDFADLPTEDIERIEVIRGGHSGIYGSKAIGGVINVVTRSGRGPIRVEATGEIGGLETRGGSLRASGGTDRAWLSASAQHRGSDGFNIAERGSEKDPWRSRSLALKGGLKLLPGVTVDFSIRETTRFANTDPEGISPLTGLYGAIDGIGSYETNVLLAGVNLKWDSADGAFTQILRANRNESDGVTRSAFGTSRNLSEAERVGYLATYRFATPGLLGARHAVSGLAEKEMDAFTPFASFTDGLRRERERNAFVAEYRGEYFDRVFLSASVRHDDNDAFKDFTTWRTSVSVPIPEIGIRPHASVGTSVALPGMFEQFGSVLNNFVGNPNLTPEESIGWDAGVEFTFDARSRTVLDVTYFSANLKNEIAADFTNFPVYTLRNLAGESTREGVEVAFKSQPLSWLYLGASYTYLDSRDPDGVREIRRSPHAARADMTATFAGGNGSLNLAAIYNGQVADLNFGTFPSTRVTLDDYLLVNAALSYKIDPRVELFVRGENLLDQDYQEIYGYNTPGLAAYAGFRIKLEDPSTAHWEKYR